MSQNAPNCPRCAQARRTVSMMMQSGKVTDADGYRCTPWLCPECALTIGSRDVRGGSPCKNCGHVDMTPIRGDDGLRPGTGAVTDARTFMDQMRGNSIPGAP